MGTSGEGGACSARLQAMALTAAFLGLLALADLSDRFPHLAGGRAHQGAGASAGRAFGGDKLVRSSAGCGPVPHLDYVEVGTSSFEHFAGEVDAELRSGVPESTLRRGVSVDAMKLYVDMLPQLPPHLSKRLNYAVVGHLPHNETLPTFYIDPVDIQIYNLPSYLRGCNRVGAPHPLQLANLRERGKLELLRRVDVRLIALQELLEETGACSIGHLKIDVEGLDASLLLAYADFLWKWPMCHAAFVQFEQKPLGLLLEAEEDSGFHAAISALGHVGYRRDNVRSIQEAVLTYNPAHDARMWARRAALNDLATAARSPSAPRELRAHVDELDAALKAAGGLGVTGTGYFDGPSAHDVLLAGQTTFHTSAFSHFGTLPGAAGCFPWPEDGASPAVPASS